GASLSVGRSTGGGVGSGGGSRTAAGSSATEGVRAGAAGGSAPFAGDAVVIGTGPSTVAWHAGQTRTSSGSEEPHCGQTDG
ncbi:MAG: hypothetical protein WBS16_09545, partial [Thermoplasmata archaeon]